MRPLIALFLVLFAATAALAEDPGGLPIGDVVPDGVVTPLGGAPTKLSALAAGKVQLFIAFQVDCPFCIKETKALNDLIGKIDQTKVNLIAVALDANEAAVKTFKEAHGVKYPLASDPNGDLIRPYNIQFVPRFYLVDGARKLRNQGGQDSSNGFQNKINAVLASPAQ